MKPVEVVYHREREVYENLDGSVYVECRPGCPVWASAHAKPVAPSRSAEATVDPAPRRIGARATEG